MGDSESDNSSWSSDSFSDLLRKEPKLELDSKKIGHSEDRPLLRKKNKKPLGFTRKKNHQNKNSVTENLQDAPLAQRKRRKSDYHEDAFKKTCKKLEWKDLENKPLFQKRSKKSNGDLTRKINKQNTNIKSKDIQEITNDNSRNDDNVMNKRPQSSVSNTFENLELNAARVETSLIDSLDQSHTEIPKSPEKLSNLKLAPKSFQKPSELISARSKMIWGNALFIAFSRNVKKGIKDSSGTSHIDEERKQTMLETIDLLQTIPWSLISEHIPATKRSLIKERWVNWKRKLLFECGYR
ncbi:hypothetical protein G9A89_022131 [Geosiphon pyriformis]|nr:hypothetical protein G9A89_022131 [Geosiphon pyriformis]